MTSPAAALPAETGKISHPRVESNANSPAHKRARVELEHDEIEHPSDDEEDEDAEDEFFKDREVETHTVALQSPTLILKVKLSICQSCEGVPGVEEIHAQVTNPADNSHVGGLKSFLIHRESSGFRGEFYERMEGASQDTTELAYKLFDRYGVVKEDFIDHPIIKGSGVWDANFSIGSFLVVESVSVDKDLRRRGLCKQILELTLQKAKGKGVRWVFAWPTQLNTDVDASEEAIIWQRNQDAAVAFFRSVGFRRVGLTSWFCYAMNPYHGSRAISPSKDVDPGRVTDFPGETGTEYFKGRYPLNYAVTTMAEDALLVYLSRELTTHPSGDVFWNAKDANGNSILHNAALSSKDRVVLWILTRLRLGFELVTNYEGHTPMEALRAELDCSRVSKYHGAMRAHISDIFTGFPQESILTILMLKFHAGGVVPADVDKAKFGCICGQCIDGFLSPRMKYFLLSIAEVEYNMYYDLYFEEDAASLSLLPAALDNEYLPAALKRSFSASRSIRYEYMETFAWIVACLKDDMIPGPGNVDEKLFYRHDRYLHSRYGTTARSSNITKNFLSANGTVADVTKVLFGLVEEQYDPLGGNEWNLLQCGDTYHQLPKCRNDSEFRFVAAQLAKNEIPVRVNPMQLMVDAMMARL